MVQFTRLFSLLAVASIGLAASVERTNAAPLMTCVNTVLGKAITLNADFTVSAPPRASKLPSINASSTTFIGTLEGCTASVGNLSNAEAIKVLVVLGNVVIVVESVATLSIGAAKKIMLPL
ncbi:hypothetical protein B0H19DRAFT_1068882 [Mycena capillaripes]|nr:hypothetical protein B0H19DRAFT_1068882 [Mycena capillaripes]